MSGRCGETWRGTGEHLRAMRRQGRDRAAHVAQRKVRASRRNEPRIFPHREIMLTAVARIRRAQIKR